MLHGCSTGWRLAGGWVGFFSFFMYVIGITARFDTSLKYTKEYERLFLLATKIAHDYLRNFEFLSETGYQDARPREHISIRSYNTMDICIFFHKIIL